MNRSHQTAVILASLAPMKMILDNVEEHLQQYKKNPTEENMELLSMWCTMLLTKNISDKEGVENLMDRMNEMEIGANMFSKEKKN